MVIMDIKCSKCQSNKIDFTLEEYGDPPYVFENEGNDMFMAIPYICNDCGNEGKIYYKLTEYKNISLDN